MTALRRPADLLSLQKAANLGDLANVSTARANLELDSPLRADWYGAVADLVRKADGVMTSGSGVVTSSTGAFTALDVGKPFVMQGAGAAGAALASTILSRQSSTQVTLTDAASTSVANLVYTYGTDNTAAFRAMLTAASTGVAYGGSDYSAPGGQACQLPAGTYGYASSLLVPHLVSLRGDGHDVTALVSLATDAHTRFANISGNTTTSLNTTLQQGGSLTYPLSGATLTVKDNPLTGGAYPAAGAAFTTTGSLVIGIGATTQTVTYTGVTSTGFTGVNGGTAGIVHVDGQPITQGATTNRRSGLTGGFMLDGNNISTPSGYLCLIGKTTQSMFADIFVTGSAGGGVIVATGQNNLFTQMQVQLNAGDGWTWDYGAGGNERFKCEISNNGIANGYNEKSIQSGASVLGYKHPTNNTTHATIFERVTDGQIGSSYFGAGLNNIYADCNFASSAATTLTQQAPLPTGTIRLASTVKFPTSGTVALTDGTNTDIVTYTGKTTTTLTGCTGGTHTFEATVTFVKLDSPKISQMTFRNDAVNGATLSSGWRFHNTIIQGMQDLTRAIDAVGNVSIYFTGQSEMLSHNTIFYPDDTAQIFGEPRTSTFTTIFTSQGGTKTKDQVVRPLRGARAPTTQGIPTLTTIRTNPQASDGDLAVDNVNNDLYFVAGGSVRLVPKSTTSRGPDVMTANPSIATPLSGSLAMQTALKPSFYPVNPQGWTTMNLQALQSRVRVVFAASTVGLAVYQIAYSGTGTFTATLVAQINAAISGATSGIKTQGVVGFPITLDFTTTTYVIGTMVSDTTTLTLSAVSTIPAHIGAFNWTDTARASVTDWPSSFTESSVGVLTQSASERLAYAALVTTAGTQWL